MVMRTGLANRPVRRPTAKGDILARCASDERPARYWERLAIEGAKHRSAMHGTRFLGCVPRRKILSTGFNHPEANSPTAILATGVQDAQGG